MRKLKVVTTTVNGEIPPVPKVARIVRFVAESDLYPGHVCEFDRAKNILKINRDIYGSLNEQQQKQVWRCSDTLALF